MIVKRYIKKIKMWIVARHNNKKSVQDNVQYFVTEQEADEYYKKLLIEPKK